MSEKSIAIRGPVLTYTGDPFKNGLEHTMVYESDAIVAMADGTDHAFRSGRRDPSRYCRRAPRSRTTARTALISAGFIDSHVHFPQTPMIAAYGEQLLDWLNKYTFPTEQKYSGQGVRPLASPRFFCARICATASPAAASIARSIRNRSTLCSRRRRSSACGLPPARS